MTRVIPDRTRLIVIHRDGGHCQVPGCTGRHVEIHHIIHWNADGVTETWNLICLCPQHHRLHHRGELNISGNADQPDTVVFTNPRGSPIQGCGRPIAPNGPLPRSERPYRHPLGERLHGTWLYFNPPKDSSNAN